MASSATKTQKWLRGQQRALAYTQHDPNRRVQALSDVDPCFVLKVTKLRKIGLILLRHSSSGCGGCVVSPGSNVRPAAPAVDGRACRCGVNPSIPLCRHSGDNSCGLSNDKSRVCGLRDAHCASYSRGGTVTSQLEAGGRPAQHDVCVCVCWHAVPTPYSLLQNLHLCVLPAVSLPASSSCCRFAGS